MERCKVYFDRARVALGVCPLEFGSKARGYYGDYYASEEMVCDPFTATGKTYDTLKEEERANRTALFSAFVDNPRAARCGKCKRTVSDSADLCAVDSEDFLTNDRATLARYICADCVRG